MQSLPPAIADKFQPEKLLAEGGFGSVWLTTQVSLSRPAAVKVLHAAVLEDMEQIARFGREARVTARLRSPHIVVVLDHGVDEGVPWIAYEYIEGDSLRRRLQHGALPWREACQVIEQVLMALEVAHAEGILHRDIKPDNILESDPGHYKVADFGIARWAGNQTVATVKGVILGTPAYLSPTQIRGEVPAPESDLYAAGITLFELVSGRRPFEAPSPLELLEHQLMKDPPRLRELMPEVPLALDRLVARALAKSRVERFQDAREFLQALREVMQPARPSARATVRPRPAPALEASRVVSPPSSRRIWPAVIGVLFLLGLALGLARNRPPAPFFGETRFGGLDEVELAASRSVPEGARLIVRDSSGAELLCDIRLMDSGNWSIRGLPPRTPCRVVIAVPGVTDPLPGATFTTPAREDLVETHVFATDQLIQLTLHRSPVGLDIDLGRGQPIRWEPNGTLPSGDFRHIAFRGLEPATEYWLRARVPGRWGGLAPFRVLTQPAGHQKDVGLFLDYVMQQDQDEIPLGAVVVPQAPVDPRVIAPLSQLLRNVTNITDDLMRIVAEGAADLRSSELARAVYRLLDRFARPETRVTILAAACVTALPGARDNALHELMIMEPGWPRALLISAMRQAGLSIPPSTGRKLLERGIILLPSDLAVMMIREDPRAAGREFLDWLSADSMARRESLPQADSDSWLQVAEHGLRGLPLDVLEELIRSSKPSFFTSQQAGRLAAALAIRREPGACATLRSLQKASSAGASWGVHWILADCPEERALHEGTFGRQPDLPAYVAALGLVGGGSRLHELIGNADPETRLNAAWAAAMSAHRPSTPALAAAIRSNQDAGGLMLWSLARLRANEAVDLIRQRLEAMVASPAVDPTEGVLLPWAAGEILLEEARPLLEALEVRKDLAASARGSVRDALSWIQRGRVPRTYLIPPTLALLRLDRRLVPGESCDVTVTPITDRKPDDHPRPWTLLGAGATTLSWGRNRVLATSTAHGELVLSRFGNAALFMNPGIREIMIRVVVED